MKIAKFALPVLALIGIVLLVQYYRTETAELEAQVDRLERALARDAPAESALRQLLNAEEPLYRGDYARALDAFQLLATDSTLLAAGYRANPRIDFTRRLQARAAELDTLRVMASREPADPLPTLAETRPLAAVAAPLEDVRPNQYDSLTFALRKAETRIQQLENRRRTRSSDYLEMESSRGNTFYYVGDVRNGKAHGRGVALYSTGSRYIGEWRDNKRHGEGEFFWKDGASYAGTYEDDQRSGVGTYHFPGGEVYVGDWAGDDRNGQGVLYDKKGKVLARGRWEDDEYVQRKK